MICPEQVPVKVVIRDGHEVIFNTRSSAALERALIPREEWTIEDVTGNPRFEYRLYRRLQRNNLPRIGTPDRPISEAEWKNKPLP